MKYSILILILSSLSSCHSRYHQHISYCNGNNLSNFVLMQITSLPKYENGDLYYGNDSGIVFYKQKNDKFISFNFKVKKMYYSHKVSEELKGMNINYSWIYKYNTALMPVNSNMLNWLKIEYTRDAFVLVEMSFLFMNDDRKDYLINHVYYLKDIKKASLVEIPK